MTRVEELTHPPGLSTYLSDSHKKSLPIQYLKDTTNQIMRLPPPLKKRNHKSTSVRRKVGKKKRKMTDKTPINQRNCTNPPIFLIDHLIKQVSHKALAELSAKSSRDHSKG